MAKSFQQKKLNKQEKRRLKVKVLLKSGKFTKAQIARRVGISLSSVYRIQKRKPWNRKKGSGRRPTLTKGDKMRLNQALLKNPFLSCFDLITHLRLHCCQEVVRIYLLGPGFRRRRPNASEPLDSAHKTQRQWFCEDFQDFQYWEYVIYSDETGFWPHDSGKLGWFKDDPFSIWTEDRHPDKINVWASICAIGKVDLIIYENNLDGPEYKKILTQAIPKMKKLYPVDFFFQQDNHPVHTYDICQPLLEKIPNLRVSKMYG